MTPRERVKEWALIIINNLRIQTNITSLSIATSFIEALSEIEALKAEIEKLKTKDK